MHGLIHAVFKKFVLKTSGKETWIKVLEKVVSVDREQVFLALTAHPDGLTFAAIETFCSLVNQRQDVVLERFGSFFAENVAEEGYMTFLKSLGENLYQFLSNINILHHTIERDSKAAVFPLFSVKHLAGDPQSEQHVFLLSYGSMRPGLTPFLHGVLTKAAFLLFQCALDVEDVTPSYPPEMGRDILVQVSFQITVSRTGSWSHETQSKKAAAATASATPQGSFFDFHAMLAAMWRCNCSAAPETKELPSPSDLHLQSMAPADTEPSVWAIIMEKQDKIEDILRAYDGMDAGVNVVPRMTGGDRMRLAAVLFRGIGAEHVSASWTDGSKLQEMGDFWATNSVSYGDKFRDSRDWNSYGDKSIVGSRRARGEILFVSHCWNAPREWAAESAGATPYGHAKAAELYLHAKDVAANTDWGDRNWKDVGFWIDKACIPQSDPGLMSWCVNLLEEFIALSDGMVILASWNYFNRLWCVYEWVCGLLIHDVMEIEILADPFVRDSTVDLYLHCIRNFSISRCECAVESDRQILIDKVHTYYKSVEDFERFFQFTVIACFIRCMATRRTGQAGSSLRPWIDLASACGFIELATKAEALQQQIQRYRVESVEKARSPATHELQAAVSVCVDDFFEEEIVPLMEKERAEAGNHLGLTYVKGLQELADDAKQSKLKLGEWVNEIAMIGRGVLERKPNRNLSYNRPKRHSRRVANTPPSGPPPPAPENSMDSAVSELSPLRQFIRNVALRGSLRFSRRSSSS